MDWLSALVHSGDRDQLESYPDLFQPFADGVEVIDSYVTLPDLPGIGFEGKADLYREMKALSD